MSMVNAHWHHWYLFGLFPYSASLHKQDSQWKCQHICSSLKFTVVMQTIFFLFLLFFHLTPLIIFLPTVNHAVWSYLSMEKIVTAESIEKHSDVKHCAWWSCLFIFHPWNIPSKIFDGPYYTNEEYKASCTVVKIYLFTKQVLEHGLNPDVSEWKS